MPPTPSPAPLLVQIVGSGGGAPWWGVPVIAGAFILIGGYLSYLWSRSNDKRRLEAERTEALTTELIDLAAEFTSIARKFGDLAQRSLVVPMQEFLPHLVEESTELIAQHTVLYNRFRLVMPRSIQETVVTYSAATISLTFPPFDETSMNPRLNNYVASEQAFVNALRRLRGLTDLETAGREDDQQQRTAFADHVTDQLIRNMNQHGVEIVDRENGEK